MKKLAAILTTTALAFTLTACGEKESYLGKYNVVVESSNTFSIYDADNDDYGLLLNKGGSGTFIINGKSNQLDWSKIGETLKIKFTRSTAENTAEGVFEGDTVVFNNFLGEGRNFILAKEGTEAAKIDNYFSEEAKKLFGTWTASSVIDENGEAASGALSMVFLADGKAEINFDGKEIESVWACGNGEGYMTEEEIYWSMDGEKMEVLYNVDGKNLRMICGKTA